MSEIDIEKLSAFLIIATLITVGIVLYKYEQQSIVDIHKNREKYLIKDGTSILDYKELKATLSCCERQYVQYRVHSHYSGTTIFQQKYFNKKYYLQIDGDKAYSTDSYDDLMRVLISHIRAIK